MLAILTSLIYQWFSTVTIPTMKLNFLGIFSILPPVALDDSGTQYKVESIPNLQDK
ncbi:hypothetical protein HK096_011473, partial [Nowakowskiella sp. JEL0078]